MKIKIKKYKKVLSTNDTAIKLIKQKNPEPTLVVSERQIKGRGRVGKKNGFLQKEIFLYLYFSNLIKQK